MVSWRDKSQLDFQNNRGKECWVRTGWKYEYSWFSAADGAVEITK